MNLARTAIVCLAVVGWMQSTSATIIYSDSFNRIEGSGDTNNKPADPNNFSDWGSNDNA